MTQSLTYQQMGTAARDRAHAEWHLRKIFTKLGIGSRRELHVALAQLGHDDEPGRARA
jgi:hypothetical protein